jgi:HD superfamily phosphohydrolase
MVPVSKLAAKLVPGVSIAEPAGTSSGVAQFAIDGAKGLPAIEAVLIARLFMFQQVYLHKATRSAEWMIRAVLARAARCVADGERLPSMPRALELGAHGEPIALGDYLELDDALLSTAIHAWEGAPDPGLADLARRVRVRALFKTLELFGEQATPEGRARNRRVEIFVGERAR